MCSECANVNSSAFALMTGLRIFLSITQLILHRRYQKIDIFQLWFQQRMPMWYRATYPTTVWKEKHSIRAPVGWKVSTHIRGEGWALVIQMRGLHISIAWICSVPEGVMNACSSISPHFEGTQTVSEQVASFRCSTKCQIERARRIHFCSVFLLNKYKSLMRKLFTWYNKRNDSFESW